MNLVAFYIFPECEHPQHNTMLSSKIMVPKKNMNNKALENPMECDTATKLSDRS